jgi:glycosyltransferase involved in cell wall biosynthesis
VKIVVVSCVFPPEPVVSSRTSFDVARALAARGHEVTVIAPFPNRPGGRLYAGYRRALFRREITAEGLHVIRCASLFSRRASILSRLGENISFGFTSTLAFLFCRKTDVVYANTWPIFGAAMLAFATRLRGIPRVTSVQDMFPESLVAQRRGGTRFVHRAMLAIDRFVSRRAAAVVVISRRFADHYMRTRGVEPSRIHVVPNWLAGGEMPESQPLETAAVRARHSIPEDAFLLVYGGNVGTSAAVETVIEAMRDPGVYLLIAGEGTSLEACRRLAARVAPERVRFESPWSDTFGILQAADAFVLPTVGAQSSSSVPSKLISYLFAGRPIVAVALNDSDTAEAMHASGAGMVVPPEDPQALADAIRDLSRMPARERRRMGESGRTWAMANVAAEACLPKLLQVIEQVAR